MRNDDPCEYDAFPMQLPGVVTVACLVITLFFCAALCVEMNKLPADSRGVICDKQSQVAPSNLKEKSQ